MKTSFIGVSVEPSALDRTRHISISILPSRLLRLNRERRGEEAACQGADKHAPARQWSHPGHPGPESSKWTIGVQPLRAMIGREEPER
jgi:hypothetical protein